MVPRIVSGVGLAVAAGVACLLLAVTGSPWWLGVVAVVLSGVVALLLVLRCNSRFGGITGDVLGAGIELTLAALLIVASAGLSTRRQTTELACGVSGDRGEEVDQIAVGVTEQQ